ncbi:acyltransferase family protein [Rothia sp. ZJ1223]|uniref:acyltransferase family protein n=1 Tax=Rothia sp. ZJ1223 TaxID=2811098 RepID=UPI001EF594E0
MRALAVLFVVINHLWADGFTGCYIGVDIFFVISSYLITSHLLKEISSTRKVMLPRFYARRARRLLPAALLVTVTTLVLTVIYAPAQNWGKTLFEGFAATAYFQNWALYSSATDYFAQANQSSPFQHYWSLSVEEQFYLLWSVLFLVFWHLSRKTALFFGAPRALPTILLGITLLLILASLIFSTQELQTNPAGAYFNTFGRAWEFLSGGVVALGIQLGSHKAQINRPLAFQATLSILQVGSWVALFTFGFFYSENTSFPGVMALSPVLATLLILATGPITYTPALRTAISFKPVQFIGDISYSLYLWHWPLMILLPYILQNQLDFWSKLGILGGSILLAWLSKVAVEDPSRRHLFTAFKPHVTLATALASVIIMAGATSLLNIHSAQTQQNLAAESKKLFTSTEEAAAQSAEQDPADDESAEKTAPVSCYGANQLMEISSGCPKPAFAPAVLSVATADEAPWGGYPAHCQYLVNENLPNIAVGFKRILECDFSVHQQPSQEVWLIGNSHAEHWMHALIPIANANNWKLTLDMQSSCPAINTPLSTRHFTEPFVQECLTWYPQTLAKLQQVQPDLVFYSSNASSLIDAPQGLPMLTENTKKLEAQVKAISEDTEIVVLRDTPHAGDFIGPACIQVSGSIESGCTAPLDKLEWRDYLADAASDLSTKHHNLHSLNMLPYFCVDDTCSGVIGEVPVYYDSNHISRSYAKSLAPALRYELGKALDQDFAPPVYE